MDPKYFETLKDDKFQQLVAETIVDTIANALPGDDVKLSFVRNGVTLVVNLQFE